MRVRIKECRKGRIYDPFWKVEYKRGFFWQLEGWYTDKAYAELVAERLTKPDVEQKFVYEKVIWEHPPTTGDYPGP